MEFRNGTPEEVGMSPERVKGVENLIEGWVRNGVSQAIVMFAARRGVVVSHKAFGTLTPEPDAPSVALDTLYPLASLSKPITATCAMILQERGLIDLYRPVAQYIPEFKGEGKDKVRVYHLLSHTSGMNNTVMRDYVNQVRGTIEVPPPEPTQHPNIHEELYLSYGAPLWKKPGEEMSYCGYGYTLIGEIIRRVSKQSLDDFARENIFEPLGMKDTHFIVPEEKYGRVVKRKPPAGREKDWFSDPYRLETPYASGGAYSTVRDMAIFGQMYLNKGTYGGKRILSPVTIAEMAKNQTPGLSARFGEETFPEAVWGYGWNMKDTKKDNCGTLRSSNSINHGGDGGVSLWADFQYGTVLVYFSVDAKQNIDLYSNAMLACIEEV